MRRLVLYLGVGFVVSRAAYWAAGVRFDATPLDYFWQYLDPALLRMDLLRSCFYLHCQPPFFNMFLGAVLKLPPDAVGPVFHGTFLSASFLVAVAILLLQIKLGVRKSVAFAVAVIFMVSPSSVLYEHWLFYTLPAAGLLIWSAVSLRAFVESRRTSAAMCTFILLALLVGTCSVFHLAHFVLVVAAFIVVCRRHWRRVAIAALLPLLVLVALSAKNLVLFGEFASSTWLGMNVWGTTGRNLQTHVRERLVDEGKLSSLALVPPFSRLSRYPESYALVSGFDDVPALSRAEKSTGASNMNHLAYVGISNGYAEDAFFVARHYPGAVCTGFARAWFQYFKSTTDDGFLSDNRSEIAAVASFYDRVFYGELPFDLSRVGRLPIYSRARHHRAYMFLMIGLPGLVGWGALLALRSHRRGAGLDSASRTLVLYLCFNIVYVAVVTNSLVMAENNRIRFMTDPLSVVLVGLLLERLLARATESRARAAAGT